MSICLFTLSMVGISIIVTIVDDLFFTKGRKKRNWERLKREVQSGKY